MSIHVDGESVQEVEPRKKQFKRRRQWERLQSELSVIIVGLLIILSLIIFFDRRARKRELTLKQPPSSVGNYTDTLFDPLPDGRDFHY